MAKKKEFALQRYAWFGWLLAGVLSVTLFLQQGLGHENESAEAPLNVESVNMEESAESATAPAYESVSLLDLFSLWLGSREKMALPFSDGVPPQGTASMARFHVNNCPPVPDGVCGSTWEIFAASKTSSTVYIGTTAGGPMGYYGPYSVGTSLPKMLEQARYIREFTTL